MMNIDSLIRDITETLRDKGVEKIILFGSYANGAATVDSDLDIIVVTTDDYMPSSNREKMELHHRYNILIKKFRKEIPIDMLVYTRMMYRKLQETENLFTQEISQKGRILYEAIN